MPFLSAPLPPPYVPLLIRVGCILLCGLWLLAGNLGHDPWKTEDAIHLNLAFGMTPESWLIPRLAGEPWITSPPLFHWVAAVTGKILSGILSWHESARLATALFAGLFMTGLSLAANRLTGPSSSIAAPLLIIGTLGMLVPLHDANPVAAGLAGWSISLWGLSCWRQKPVQGGLLHGAGIGIGFLAIGVQGAILPFLTGLLLLLHPYWRGRHAVLAVFAALLVAVLIIAPWPWLLHDQSPKLFGSWWRSELTRRPLALGFSRDHFELLGWAAWPVLPLAFWALWLERRRLGQFQNLLPLVGAAVALIIFFFSEPKDVALLPALVPLTLLATQGAARLRRGAANAFDWFGMMTFTLLAAIIWLGGVAILTGEPQRIAKNFSHPAPDFTAQLSIALITLAIAASVGWIAVMLRTPRSAWRASALWSVGLTTVWVLISALLLPWIDHVRSYRQVSADLSEALPKSKNSADCIAREGLGPGHRASLDYFNGIRTVAISNLKGCKFLIVQTNPKTEKRLSGWKLLVEASRPGDKSERLRLYRRV